VVLLKEEVKKTKKLFKDAFDTLNDFFEEKRSDTVLEKEKKAKKGKVALAKFSKGMIGNTNKINFRILIGENKEIGDFIYEAVYLSDKKEPRIFVYKVNKGRPVKNILTNFKDEDWDGYSKVKKYKSLTKYLEDAYENGIYYKGKKEKKEDALNRLIKGLKRSLEAVGEDVEEKGGKAHPVAVKIAKIVAVAAVTTIVSAALTPAAGVVAQEVLGGGAITGDVIGQAGQAAVEGVKELADPTKIVGKVVKKAITKGRGLKD
jgi:hypothetical protein